MIFKTSNKSNNRASETAANSSLPENQDLVRAGSLLARENSLKDLVSVLVEQSQDITHADLTAFYLFKESGTGSGDQKPDLKLYFKRGRYSVPETISGDVELVRFLCECREALVFNNALTSESFVPEKDKDFLKEVLINSEMESAMALPIFSPLREIGVLFVCSLVPRFFNRRRFYFLDSFAKLAGGAMQNALLSVENRRSLQKIDSLERYQENVFNSMTNLVITTDPAGQIFYFNEAAGQEMGLEENDLGRSIEKFFKNALSSNTIKTISRCLQDGTEVLGLEGIYRGKNEMDYSLNIAPLKTPRGKKEGLTLLFTNQTREKELKQTVSAVTEERRVIKDMFARYMSQEVMASLMETPDSVKLGGDKRNATVFFADIRGYTSFSEGRDPQEIVEILNEYFSEAVEYVLKYKGYIDKFIGDCIMAVWGVPMAAEKDDAINAVSCALTIQSMVRSPKRNFFKKKDSSRLRVGIGVNTGPLVAGNLGSMQRMDYSVIGDTVNVAARLEGVAGADEVIISQSTRDYIGDAFLLEKRPEVKVKGKEKPIQIYNVVGLK